ncbi:MAG: (S)-2-haloacid dehalogenase [Candidatus Dichloromethanomonas elyunquensis]|nr:MAG: (S)-2-haloacid dehalogenase [Candidatus Dichloromethanomonas elyunquensis]
MIKACAFDAYGTIYDVHSVTEKCDQVWPGKGAQISQIWRLKQLQYSWQRSLMGNYQNFWELTKFGLKYALEMLKLPHDDKILDEVLDKYYHLDPYSDVTEALETFAPRELVIMSNGSPDMLDKVISNNGHYKYFTRFISVDELKVFKPKPDVYALTEKYLNVKKEEILFVSCNGWDAAGAKNYGFTTGWINRNDEPIEKLGNEPDFIVKSLIELAQKVKGL